ncbi:MAG: DUF1553 domain-containing protein, partial [Candidatus Omnitrophica bacterium]|nr:DUF1553 domain-containing protein [Candidatus Omnitrophota bacterium]
MTQKRREAAIATLPDVSREYITSTADDLEKKREELSVLPDPKWVYSAASEFKKQGNFSPCGEPRTIHLLPRGDIGRPGKEVVPAALRVLHHQPAVFDLDKPNDEGQRRAALANWISHPENAFFWRSIVNRVWHYHFGKGLVDTPNDFGKMGSEPTHPELLDWLAVAFRENGGSLKWLHKLIVTSAAYRQVSTGNENNAKIDAGNRYLWRMNRMRLDAESVRDAILCVSGKMDFTMGGPGYDLFGFIDDHSPHYLYRELDVDNPKTHRRTIYRFIVRSVPDPLMECLDCADPSQNVPVRNQTLTPLQSLALLNNPFTVRMSEHLAA